jgi:hypothetical protein
MRLALALGVHQAPCKAFGSLSRSAACPHSLGAVGGLVSSAGIVSREWAAIQSTAPSSEVNFPKWCTAPFGHTIRTRQISPSRTGNKTVHRVTIKLKYASLDDTDKPFG